MAKGEPEGRYVPPDLGALDEPKKTKAKILLKKAQILANHGWKYAPARLRHTVLCMGARPSTDVGFGLLDHLAGRTED